MIELCWGEMVPISNLQFASILVFFFLVLEIHCITCAGGGS